MFIIFIVLLFLCIPFAFLGIVLYLIRKKQNNGLPVQPENRFNLSEPLIYPVGVSIALPVLLIGYQLGLYDNVQLGGQISRVPSLGLTIFGITLAGMWLSLFLRRSLFQTSSFIAMIVIVSFGIYLRANGFVQYIDGVFLGLLSLFLLLKLATSINTQWTIPRIFSATFRIFSLYPLQILKNITSVFSKKTDKSKSAVGWVKTLVITTVVLFLFAAILSNADPVFAEIIKDFREQFFGRVINSILLILIAGAFLSTKISNFSDETEHKLFSWLSYRDITWSVGSLIILIGIFLGVQFRYLFGGSQSLLIELGLTFSEYVRKGFNELLFATFIGGFFSYIVARSTRTEVNSQHRKILTLFNVLLILELILLLVSALKRDLLYVDTYGLTRVRIVGGIFLVWLFGFLISLFGFSLIKKIKEQTLLVSFWLLSILAVIALNVINIDQKIIVGAPGHHEYTDYFYLFQLSEDAADRWLPLIDQIEPELQTLTTKEELSDKEKAQLAGIKLALASFIEKRNRLFLLYQTDAWLLDQGWKVGWNIQESTYDLVFRTGWDNSNPDRQFPENLKNSRHFMQSNQSEVKAYTLLSQENNQPVVFERANNMFKRIILYQMRNQISLQNEENLLLHELKYPFIRVKLNSYYVQNFYPVSLSENQYYQVSGTTFKAIKEIEENQDYSLDMLEKYTCATLPEEPIVTYAVIGSTLPVQDGSAIVTIPLSKFENTRTPILSILANHDIQIKSLDYNNYVSTSHQEKTPQYTYKKITDISEPIFTQLTLEAKASGGLECRPIFTATKITEILGF